MYSNWIKQLQEAKSAYEYNEILINVLKGLEDNLDRQEVSSKVYDNPNWSYLQAHLNGSRETLRTLLKLTSLDQAERNHDR